MDYTPINARRVLFAIGLTLIIGLTPVAFCLLAFESSNLSNVVGISAVDGYRGGALVVGSVLLASVMAVAGMVLVRLGHRLVRRPLRA